jgi:hypothetical protein
MKTMMKTLFLAALLVPLAAACGDDDDGGTVQPDASMHDAAVPDGGGPPVKPTLGAQIDRLGRPAVNTAVNKTFSADATRATAEDTYNHAGDPSTWAAMFGADMKATIAILDGLDANCGNQLAADAVNGMRYAFLAGVLADDMLQVDLSQATCAQYLGVEAKALGVNINDCGGRRLDYDVVDTSYSVLAVGQPAGVEDGVEMSATVSATFPYLGAPTAAP